MWTSVIHVAVRTGLISSVDSTIYIGEIAASSLALVPWVQSDH